MVGAPRYSDDQLWFVIELLRKGLKHQEIIRKFNGRWPFIGDGETFGPKQLKYLKQNYDDDPSFVITKPLGFDLHSKKEDGHDGNELNTLKPDNNLWPTIERPNGDFQPAASGFGAFSPRYQLGGNEALAEETGQVLPISVTETDRAGPYSSAMPVIMPYQNGGDASNPAGLGPASRSDISQTGYPQGGLEEFQSPLVGPASASMSLGNPSNIAVTQAHVQLPRFAPKRTLDGSYKNDPAGITSPWIISNQGLGETPAPAPAPAPIAGSLPDVGHVYFSETWYYTTHGQCPFSVQHRHDDHGGVHFKDVQDVYYLMAKGQATGTGTATGDGRHPRPKRRGRLDAPANPSSPPIQRPGGGPVYGYPSAQPLSWAVGGGTLAVSAMPSTRSAGQSPTMNFSSAHAIAPPLVTNSALAPLPSSISPSVANFPGPSGGAQIPSTLVERQAAHGFVMADNTVASDPGLGLLNTSSPAVDFGQTFTDNYDGWVGFDCSLGPTIPVCGIPARRSETSY